MANLNSGPQTILRISGILKESIVDGPGLRYVIFTQGCPHHCEGCHNPKTHSFEAGEEVSVDTILEEIEKNPLLKGVTFSGGEPFCQPEALYEIATRLKKKDIVCYSGYTFEQLLALSKENQWVGKLLGECNILIDGKFDLEKRSLGLKFRGSTNQRLIDVQESLKSGVAVTKEF